MPAEHDAKSNYSWLSRLLRRPNDDPVKMLTVIVSLCIVCSAVVSAAAVVLRPQQFANKALDRRQNILAVAGLTDTKKSVDELFAQIEPRVIDIRTGEYVSDVDPQRYDQRAAARDPQRNIDIPADDDLAKIGTQARYAQVYLVRQDSRLTKIILPVHGLGLWSTIYGFIALESDANTIADIKFYEHEETPGLGDKIDDPRWQDLWHGKHIYDDSGQVRFEIIKGAVDPRDAAAAKFKVDGIAGATLTSRGVNNMVRYWLGANGFGPYLEKIRSSGG